MFAVLKQERKWGRVASLATIFMAMACSSADPGGTAMSELSEDALGADGDEPYSHFSRTGEWGSWSSTTATCVLESPPWVSGDHTGESKIQTNFRGDPSTLRKNDPCPENCGNGDVTQYVRAEALCEDPVTGELLMGGPYVSGWSSTTTGAWYHCPGIGNPATHYSHAVMTRCQIKVSHTGYCGDGQCSDSEDCESCEIDCGTCGGDDPAECEICPDGTLCSEQQNPGTCDSDGSICCL